MVPTDSMPTSQREPLLEEQSDTCAGGNAAAGCRAIAIWVLYPLAVGRNVRCEFPRLARPPTEAIGQRGSKCVRPSGLAFQSDHTCTPNPRTLDVH